MTRVRRREADRLMAEVAIINKTLSDLGMVITDYKNATYEDREKAQEQFEELRGIKDDLMWRVARIRLAAKTEDELGTTATATVQAVVDKALPKPTLDVLELIQ